MPATTRDKMEFAFVMAKHSAIAMGELQRLIRYGTTLHRLAETECNREMTVSEIKKQERIQMDVIAILAPIDCEAVIRVVAVAIPVSNAAARSRRVRGSRRRSSSSIAPRTRTKQ